MPAASSKPKSSRTCCRATTLLVLLALLGAGTYAILGATNVITPFWSSPSTAAPATPPPTAPNSPQSPTKPPTNATSDGDRPTLPPVATGGLLGSLVAPVPNRILFGAHIWGDNVYYAPKSPQDWNTQLNATAIRGAGAGFGAFVLVDMKDGVVKKNEVLRQAVEVQKAKAYFLMTLEPMDGLEMMTPEVIGKCVDVMKEINDMGVPILLRFAHEMNGAWYKWGQRPVQYKATWAALTKAVRDKAKLTSMVWSPNTVSGYPWSDKMLPKPGSDEFRALDTNGDGAVTNADDALAPYYPGADLVDWIGQSAFHFGPYPFGTNTLPDTGGIAGMLGPILAFARTPAARGGADKPVKPFGIFEAGATYHPKPTNGEFADGTDAGMKRNVDMKTSWLAQMTSEATYNLGVRLAMWFDFAKVEMEGGSVGLDRDFALTKTDQVKEAARRALAASVAVGAVRD